MTSGSLADFELEVREYEGYHDIYRLRLILNPSNHSRISLEFTLPNLEVLEQALSYLQAGCLEHESQGIINFGQ